MSDPVAPAVTEAPVETKAPEVEPSDEYEIDGKKVSLTRTQAKTWVQKGAAADKRFKEAADAKAKHEDWLKLFEEDPEEALRKLGKDPDTVFAKHMAKKAQQALLTPEQREAQALKDERDALKADKEKKEKAEKEASDQKLDEMTFGAVQEQLVAAADRYGVDPVPEALDDLCAVGLELCELGIIPTVDQVVQEYQRREGEHFEKRDAKYVSRLKGDKLKSYLKSNATALAKLPAAELLEVLGPEGVKAVHDATLTKLPTPGAPRPKAVEPPPRNGSGQFTRHISEAQFDKKFGR